MIQAKRLGYVVLSVRNLAQQADYFQSVIGLQVTNRDHNRIVLSTASGVESLVLAEDGRTPGLAGMSLQLAPDVRLEDVAVELRKAGRDAHIRPGSTPCVEEVISFVDPNGIEVELFNRFQFAPESIDEMAIAPLKLGHVATLVQDVTATMRFYCDVLGFRRSDWREGRTEFLRCGPDHHTVNFFLGEQTRLQHIAFELKDAPELMRAADYLRRRGRTLDWGPGRHHIGHNIACYHSNDEGIRIELYCEMDQMKDEALGFFEPRPWHQDRPQCPKEWSVETTRNYWIPGAP